LFKYRIKFLGKLCSVRIIDTGQYHNKFIAAPARKRSPFGCAFAQSIGYFNEHLITGCMSVKIVDIFKAVQIEEHHRIFLLWASTKFFNDLVGVFTVQ